MFNLKDYNLDDRVSTLVCSSISQYDLDEDKIEKWLKENNVAFKSNPSAWVLKVFTQEMNKGLFSRVEYVPSSQILFNKMREKGMVVKQDDCMYIDLLLKRINGDEKLINDAMNYVVANFKAPTTSHFIAVIKKSKSVKKYNIDWDALQKEYEQEEVNWEATMLAVNMEGR